MAINLRDRVAEQMRQRKSDKDIRNSLVDQGYTPDYADKLIQEVRRDLPNLNRQHKERVKQQRAEQAVEKREVRRHEQSKWLWTILAGIAFIIAGVAVTAFSYAIAEPGGTYLFAYGAIFVGVFLIFKGLYHRIRWW